MGILDLFRRKPTETRSSGTGYTAAIMAARASYIAGASDLAELTATVQSCVSLWEGALSGADVVGTDMLDRRTLALVARSLALRGEFVALIRPDMIVPASDWDLSTRNGIPRAYRLSISEAGGGRSETALAAEVLHFRIGADTVAPWCGTAPLKRSALSANLLQQVESALRDVYRDAPIGSQVLPLPDSGPTEMEAMRSELRGRRGSTLVVEGVAQATAAGMNPQLGQRRDDLTPDLQKAAVVQSLAAAQASIAMAFGVLPGLLNPAVTGPTVREAQRHLATWMLQPIAESIAEEATAKLGAPVTLDVHRALQSFDAGGSARALTGIMQAMATAKAAGLSDAQIAAAFGALDWKEALPGR